MGIIEVYARTLEKDFPLVMIVGREGDSEIDELQAEVGNWDFRKAPRCAFWNTAMGVLGWTVGLETYRVKELFEAKESAPLVFSDASPFGILNKVEDKDSLRGEVEKEAFERNAQNIFSCNEVIDRLKLVILSGHHGSLKYSSELIRTECEKMNVAGPRESKIPGIYQQVLTFLNPCSCS